MNAPLVFAILTGACGWAAGWASSVRDDEERARRFFRAGSARPRHFFARNSMRWRRFKEFPEFLELLALGLSSGFTLDRAWEEALSFLPRGPLRLELLRTANDFSLGRGRAEALNDLNRRLDDERLSTPLVLLAQSLRYGTPLEGILLDQAARLRSLVMMTLERRAQTAGIRLLFPLVFFILPTVFIVLFGPLVLGFLETGRLF